MSCWLRQSTAIEVAIGPFVDSVDGNTTETALTITQPDIRLKKDGAAWAQKNAAQTLSHEENGWYEIALDATDTNTLGQLVVAVHEAGALPVWREFMVVPAQVWDSFFSTDLLQVDLTQWLGTAPLALTSQQVQAQANTLGAGIISNAALSTDSGLKPIRSGTCEAASTSSTVALDSGASATTDFYKGARIYIVAGTGAGQSRLCTAYNGTTKVATIEPNWITTPGNGTSAFAIRDDAYALGIATGGIASGSFAAGAINAAAIATGAIDADALASDTITAAKIAADAITAGKIADGAIDAATFAAGAINAAAIATGAIDDDAVAADMDAYAAKIWIIRDSSTTDRYGVGFFKNGQPVLSGITSPTIQVIKASDGTDLIAVTALTEIGSTGLFKKDEGTNKMTAGQMYFAKVQATIDGSTRTHTQQVGRDAA